MKKWIDAPYKCDRLSYIPPTSLSEEDDIEKDDVDTTNENLDVGRISEYNIEDTEMVTIFQDNDVQEIF